MKRHVLKIWACVAALCIWAITCAQTEEEAVKAAMFLNGASSEEEIEEGEVERIQSTRKIRVNAPGRGARAILSEYQLATLEDYRRHNGDILSWEELALVDGFGKEAVEALKPFLSLYSDKLPGAVDTTAKRVHGSLLLRATDKNAGTKVKAEGSIWQVGLAARLKSWQALSSHSRLDDYSHSGLDPESLTTNIDWTAHAEINLGRWDIIIGDYNIRYGQGVGVWSGFSMTSLSTVSAFSKRATGVTPVLSFLPSEHRGVAVEYRLGRLYASAFWDIGGRYGGHVSYLSLHSQIGITAISGLISADGVLNWKGVNIAGEIASKGKDSFAGKISGTLKAGNTKIAVQGRVLPTRFTGKKNGEYALATGAEWKSSDRMHILSLTADGALLPKLNVDPGRKQLKLYAIWQCQASETLAFNARYTGRLRNYEPYRNDVRLDLKYNSGSWLSNVRLEGDYCNGKGILGYLEGGYKTDNLSTYLRLTGFATDNWSSRIYCYERDAPGSFLVPAYYGQGTVVSMYGAWKTVIMREWRIKICLRSSYTLKKDQASVLSARLQIQVER